MVLRLNPRIPVVWRTPHCMQLGIDVPVCTLPEATTATQRMLAALAVGVPRSGLTLIGTRAGATTAEVAALLDAVRPALLTTPSEPPQAPRVALDGDGQCASALLDLLGRAGVNVLSANDARRQGSDAAVIIARFAITPARHAAWLRRDIPHLPIVFGDRIVRIGPFVEPGIGPCVRCVELERVDADEAWPAMATQLSGKRAAAESGICIIDTAVRATRMVIGLLTHATRANATTSILLDAETGAVTERTHRPHERCGCQALPENVTALAAPHAPFPAPTNSIAEGGAPS